jgi:hypothetical protein
MRAFAELLSISIENSIVLIFSKKFMIFFSEWLYLEQIEIEVYVLFTKEYHYHHLVAAWHGAIYTLLEVYLNNDISFSLLFQTKLCWLKNGIAKKTRIYFWGFYCIRCYLLSSFGESTFGNGVWNVWIEPANWTLCCGSNYGNPPVVEQLLGWTRLLSQYILKCVCMLSKWSKISNKACTHELVCVEIDKYLITEMSFHFSTTTKLFFLTIYLVFSLKCSSFSISRAF